MSYNKPKVPGFDDITGEPLTKRPDDNPVSLATSLRSPVSIFIDCTIIGDLCSQTEQVLRGHLSSPRVLRVQTLGEHEARDPERIDLGRDLAQLDAVIRQMFPSLPERTEPKKRHSLADAILSGEERQKRTDPTLPVL